MSTWKGEAFTMKILQDKAPWAYIKEGQQRNSTTGSFCERDLRNTQVKVF